MKLRRNPTPPPSLGGYEPLKYDDDDEDDDDDDDGDEEEFQSSPIPHCAFPYSLNRRNLLTDRFSYRYRSNLIVCDR
jgi:hypothetical protein